MPYKDPNCPAAKVSRHKTYKKWYDNRSNEYRLKRNAGQLDYHNRNKEERNRKSRERSKKLNQKYRLECLTHYGGNPPKCACCGDTNLEFLTIDHINGGGKQDRKRFVNGQEWYRWLVKNNFPEEDLRVLCYNCNCSIGHYGYCPHQKVLV